MLNTSLKGFINKWTINDFSAVAKISCEGISAILFMTSVAILLILFAILIWEKYQAPTNKSKIARSGKQKKTRKRKRRF